MNDLLLVLQPHLCQNDEKYSVSTTKPALCGAALCFVHSYCFGLSFAGSTRSTRLSRAEHPNQAVTGAAYSG